VYETLLAGRVPVIVSDAWAAPTGIDWQRCSIRVREAEVSRIPALLERREVDWEVMADAAATEADRCLSEPTRWHHIAACVEATSSFPPPGRGRRLTQPVLGRLALRSLIMFLRQRR
jgi:hypothetical protein